MQIQVLQHVPFYYFKTWNYINGNGLDLMGKVAHKKDYHKFIYLLSQQLYHPEVHHFNTRRSLWGMIQLFFEDHIIKQEDIIRLPTLKCSLFITARWLFKEYYEETDVFSKEQWEIIHKLACLIHHGVYTYDPKTERFNEKIKYGEVRKLFTEHIDPTKLLIREKNKRITSTRVRPIHYKQDDKWLKTKRYWNDELTGDDYISKDKYHGAIKDNPILLKKILEGVDLTLMNEHEGEDDRDTFYEDWIEPQINTPTGYTNEGKYYQNENTYDFEEDDINPSEPSGEYNLFLIIPHITKKDEYPIATFFHDPKDDFNYLENFYSEKHKNLCIPHWDTEGISLAYKYLCSVGITNDLKMFTAKDNRVNKNMVRIVRVYKNKWNFYPFEIEKKYK